MLTALRHQKPLPGESRTVRFEGRDYGSRVSVFLVDADPGRGVALHKHPYPETWVVKRGVAEFTVGEEKTTAFPGDIIVAAAHAPHRFENMGSERLELVCIHPNETFIQEFL